MPSQFCTQCGTGLGDGQRFCPECGTAVQTPAAPVQPVRSSSSAPAPAPSRPPLALLLGIGALAIAVVLVVIYWATAQPPAIVGNFPPVHTEDGYPFPDVPRLSVQDAKARLDAGSAIFVDVRSRGQFNASRIPGAVLIPIDEFETRYSEVPRNVEIITYCTWPSEETSARAAHILMQTGYTNAKAIQGGFEAWLQAEFPTVSGEPM